MSDLGGNKMYGLAATGAGAGLLVMTLVGLTSTGVGVLMRKLGRRR